MKAADRQTTEIVSVGARTPLGLRAEPAAAAVRAGICRFGVHPVMVDPDGKPLRFAFDPKLDPKLFGWQRMVDLAVSALAEVTAKLSSKLLQGAHVALALPETRPGFSDMDAKYFVAKLSAEPHFQEAGFKFVVAGRGHAGGSKGIAFAVERLSIAQEPACIVLGVDTYAEADTVEWLKAHRQLASEGVRSGFVPGDAAGALALTTSNTRRRLGLQSLATVHGVGTAQEAKLMKDNVEPLGEALYSAVQDALRGLSLPQEAVDTVYCDINGERYRTDEWGFTVMRLGHALRTTAYEAPSGCWGDVGAAGFLLSCMLPTQAWARGYAKGPIALAWGSSEQGLRGACVLRKPGA